MTYNDIDGFKGKKIAITGGAGFIGSHLTERLLRSGADVTVIDNFLRGNKLEYLMGHENLVIHEADIRDSKIMFKILKDKDIVFHLAAVVGVEETQASPYEVMDVEVRGTENIFDAIVENNIKMIIFGSSSEVYGDVLEPMKEESSLSPKSTYAVAKLTGEEYCKAFNQRYGVQYSILRYFNVYGPRQDERFVISRFIARALANEAICIYGDGKQTRDFTFIDDAVHMTLMAALRNEAKGQAINIGTGVSASINELALIVSKVFSKGTDLKQFYVDYDSTRPREIEIFSRTADISKSRELMQYSPQVTLESGLTRLRNYINCPGG